MVSVTNTKNVAQKSQAPIVKDMTLNHSQPLTFGYINHILIKRKGKRIPKKGSVTLRAENTFNNRATKPRKDKKLFSRYST